MQRAPRRPPRSAPPATATSTAAGSANMKPRKKSSSESGARTTIRIAGDRDADRRLLVGPELAGDVLLIGLQQRASGPRRRGCRVSQASTARPIAASAIRPPSPSRSNAPRSASLPFASSEGEAERRSAEAESDDELGGVAAGGACRSSGSKIATEIVPVISRRRRDQHADRRGRARPAGLRDARVAGQEPPLAGWCLGLGAARRRGRGVAQSSARGRESARLGCGLLSSALALHDLGERGYVAVAAASRSILITSIPAARAPSTSSSLSPTWKASAARSRRSAAPASKIAGSGLRAPAAAEVTTPSRCARRGRSARAPRRARSPSWRRRRSAGPAGARPRRAGDGVGVGLERDRVHHRLDVDRAAEPGRRASPRSRSSGAPARRRRGASSACARVVGHLRLEGAPDPLRGGGPRRRAGSIRSHGGGRPDDRAERVDQAGAVGGGHDYILPERMQQTSISAVSIADPRRRRARRLAVARRGR